MRSLDFSGLKTNKKIKIKLLNDVLSTRASVQFVSLSLGSLQGSKNLIRISNLKYLHFKGENRYRPFIRNKIDK